MSKDLQEKAIRVKGGKEYVEVAHRVKYFNENYKGNIVSDLVDTLNKETDHPTFIVKAIVQYEDGDKMYVRSGLSQATLGELGDNGKPNANTKAALENAETSAVGRALGFLDIGVIDGIASVDELKKANVKLSDDDF